MTRVAPLILLLGLVGCNENAAVEPRESIDQFNERLAATYRSKPNDLSRAYAVMKDSTAGEDWLATIHGYPDNRAVCEDLIAPYNADESRSVLPGIYRCVQLAD